MERPSSKRPWQLGAVAHRIVALRWMPIVYRASHSEFAHVQRVAGPPRHVSSGELHCPNVATPSQEASLADGLVVLQRIPDIDPGCTVTVEREGYISRTLLRNEIGYHQGIRKGRSDAPKVVLTKRK